MCIRIYQVDIPYCCLQLSLWKNLCARMIAIICAEHALYRGITFVFLKLVIVLFVMLYSREMRWNVGLTSMIAQFKMMAYS